MAVPQSFRHTEVTPLGLDDLLHLGGSHNGVTGRENTVDGTGLLQARSVLGPMPPLPTMTRTPDFCTGSYSNFSIRMEVVGPTDTISNLSSSRGRMMGPAWKMAASLTSTGSGRPSSTSGGAPRHGRWSGRRSGKRHHRYGCPSDPLRKPE